MDEFPSEMDGWMIRFAKDDQDDWMGGSGIARKDEWGIAMIDFFDR
jgi:hypothetical protein